jgi:hypothetical protein
VTLPPNPSQAFDAHLRGFRHQRRIKQAQLLQQGQEVSAMLRGLLLEEQLPSGGAPSSQLAAPASAAALGAADAGLPGAGLPPLAVRRPDLSHLYEDEGSDYSGSPSFTDRQVYSPEPTPFHCPTCNVYCTSERLLEVRQGCWLWAGGDPHCCMHRVCVVSLLLSHVSAT